MAFDVLKNRSRNLNHLFFCRNIVFTHAKYRPSETLPGVDLSLSTIKKALSGKNFTDRTVRIFAAYFSLSLLHPEEKPLTAEDFDLPHDQFKERYKPTDFVPFDHPEEAVDFHFFTNKLYRCYYIHPNSSHTVLLAYFKLYEKNGNYYARMVRGIQNFEDAEEIRKHFDSREQLLEQINNKTKKNKNEALRLYEAGSEDFTAAGHGSIRLSKYCIKIDFTSADKSPCRCSMFWNISTVTKLDLTWYIGGSALIVNTNDGDSNKNICAFKMGLEAAENLPSHLQSVMKDPIAPDSKRLIQELTLESNSGVMTLDDSDDKLWYSFIKNPAYRPSANASMTPCSSEELLSSLQALKSEYQNELHRLKTLLDRLEKKGTV